MSIGNVGDLGLRFEEDLYSSSEKKPEVAVKLFDPTSESSEVFTKLLDGKELTSLIWSCLTPEEVGSAFLVSKLWKKATSSNHLWATFHKRAFSSENKVPSSLGNARACKELYLETQRLFPSRMGVEFYREYLGDVKAPPIPEVFINKAKEVDPFDPEGRLVKDTYQLVYIPKEITITVPAGSKLALNGEGHLVEELDVARLAERTLSVPVTINNLSMLTDKCLKKGFVTGLHESSWRGILEEHGNKPVAAHWSCQKKAVVGLGASYENQTILINENHYEIAPLIDRVVLNLLTYVSSGAFVDCTKAARTSTPMMSEGRVYQSVSWVFGSRLWLCFSGDIYFVGVAVEVSIGSSEDAST